MALVAQSNRTSSSANLSRAPDKCSNRKLSGHTLPYCNKPGGRMAGKSLEDCRAKRKADRAASCGGTASSTAAAIAPVAAPVAHLSEEAHISFKTAPVESIFEASISHTMSAADVSEYETFLMVEGALDYASIDWRAELRHNDVFCAEAHSSIEASPWLLDSCASVGITHSRADFSKLVPLKTLALYAVWGGALLLLLGWGVSPYRLGREPG